MKDTVLYLSLEQSVLVTSRKVNIKDIAKLFCTNKDICYTVSKLNVFTFPDKENCQQVVTAMKLIEIINTTYKDIQIEIVGDTETIVYYKNPVPTRKITEKIKALVLMIFAFFGTGYSIMSYNGDVGTSDLIKHLYTLFIGVEASGTSKGLSLGIVMYSIGLCIGMITFFNHGINHKDEDDPTPLQVQMRLYEQNVNQSIIINSGRNKDTIDVD